MFLYLKNILQLLLAPARGWEDLAYSDGDARLLLKDFLFPLFIITALSVFVQLFYNWSLSLQLLLVRAVVTFVAYFISYYFADIMFKTFFYKMCEGEPAPRPCILVIIYCLALLSISQIICNILPVNLGFRYLLPLGVSLIMWKADDFLHVRKDKDFAFFIFGVITIIVPPMIIQSLFDIIL